MFTENFFWYASFQFKIEKLPKIDDCIDRDSGVPDVCLDAWELITDVAGVHYVGEVDHGGGGGGRQEVAQLLGTRKVSLFHYCLWIKYLDWVDFKIMTIWHI